MKHLKNVHEHKKKISVVSKKSIIMCSALTLLMTANIAFAQEQSENQKGKVEKLDEVVLSDTKFALKKENSGKIIYKIT